MSQSTKLGELVSKAGLVGLKSAAVSILLGAIFMVISHLLHLPSGGVFGFMAIMVFVASSSAYKDGLKDRQTGAIEKCGGAKRGEFDCR